MDNIKIISTNNSATFFFHVEKTLEVGVELLGWEVKSLRMYGVNLKKTFCNIHEGECWWKEASFKDPIGKNVSKRNRKILMHKKQIYKWYAYMTQDHFTIIPLRCYFKKNRYFKIEIGLCKKNKQFDQREKIKIREINRSLAREGE
jgi:SsrA-binding protein